MCENQTRRATYTEVADAWDVIMSAEHVLLRDLHNLAHVGKNNERKERVGYLDGLILREFHAEIEARREAALEALWSRTGWTQAEFDAEVEARLAVIMAQSRKVADG